MSFFRACPCVSSHCYLILLASAGPSNETKGTVTVVWGKREKDVQEDPRCSRNPEVVVLAEGIRRRHNYPPSISSMMPS